MKIFKLEIEGFRSIKKLDVEVPQICALVGPNNTGKSNILQAIQRVLGRDWISVNSFSEDDVYGCDPAQDFEIALTIDPPLEYKKFKTASEITKISTLKYMFTRYADRGERAGQRRLDQSCLDERGKTCNVLAKVPRKGEQHKYEPLVTIPPEIRGMVPVVYVGTNRFLKDHLPGARYSLLRQLIEDINADFHDPTQKVKRGADSTEEVPRSERFRELMDEVLSLLRTENFSKLEDSIKRNALKQLGFDPEVDTDKLDFFFSPFSSMDFYKSLDLMVREGNFTISATELGEGIQNALVLAILQAFEERRKQGAVILIEEPEMFLHPQMQRSLYKTIREIGKTNQIIYTTHSPHFVTIPEYNEVLLVSKDHNGTHVRRSSLPSDGGRKEKLIKEFDPERNELFFASRLLLVEGDTEKLAFPVCADRLKLDLDREGATIVEVGGKRNLTAFAEIAISFGIPTGIVYDEDASDFNNQRDEEKKFNQILDSYQRDDRSVKVWKFTKKYEDELRQALGEVQYQQLCQKYPKTSKAVRARLIAQETDSPIPEKVENILTWLAKGA